MTDKKYTLTLNKDQAQVLVQALDLFSRIGIGQFEEIVHVYDSGRMNNEQLEGNAKYDVRDQARAALDLAKKVLTGYTGGASHGIHSPLVSDKYRAAFDIQQVVRHALHQERNPKGEAGWCVSSSVYQTSAQELPIFVRNDEPKEP